VSGAVKRLLLRALARCESDTSAGLPALTYHSIDESGSPISFPSSYCRAQLGWLASRGYRAITAQRARSMLSGEQPLAPRSVVLTFDDGFRSVRETAFDLFSEFGFTATVFCTAGYIGKRCGWPRAASIPEFELMTWDDLAFLAEQGWEIGGHTVSHARLTELPEDKAREEIAAGRRTLEERLGRDVTSFAYPYGAHNEMSVEAAAAAGFTSAWTMEPQINWGGCDLLTLGRFNCDRIRPDGPETAGLAARVYVGGRYGAYAALTARGLRLRRRTKGER